MADRCVGRKCGAKVPDTAPARYVAEQCKKACVKGSNLCEQCHNNEWADLAGNPGKWHGRIDGPIPIKSHVQGGDWNAEQTAKALAKAAAAAAAVANKAAGGAGGGPVAKKAADAATKASKAAAAAARAADQEARKFMAAVRGEETAMNKAKAAAARAVREAAKAVKASSDASPASGARRTHKKKSSSSSSNTSSGSRTTSSWSSSGKRSSGKRSSRKMSPIYRRASNASASPGAYMNRWGARAATPVSSGTKAEKPNVQDRIAAEFARLPEFD